MYTHGQSRSHLSTISRRRAVMSALVFVFCAAVLPPAIQAQQSLSVREIARRLEENRTFDTSRGEMTMIIRDRFGERESTMISWSRGADEALIEFTSAAERGQKILRTADEIYLYYPDAAELVRLQGAALRESMLGSDVSYEDMTGGKTILETYNVTLDGREVIDGHETYRIDMNAKVRNVPYPRQRVWVDTELFVSRRAELYALSGRLLKTVVSRNIEMIDGHPVAIRTEISDALKSNSSTTLLIDELEIGIPLRDDIFSLEELSW